VPLSANPKIHDEAISTAAAIGSIAACISRGIGPLRKLKPPVLGDVDRARAQRPNRRLPPCWYPACGV
jgi:hypothetical protein